AARLPRLIGELDSDQFTVRESASAELERLGEAAAQSLRKALEGGPSLEVRTRVRRLLSKLETEARSKERLRQSRAMQALEHRGVATVRHLTLLAGGAAEATLTREAKAALRRIQGSTRR